MGTFDYTIDQTTGEAVDAIHMPVPPFSSTRAPSLAQSQLQICLAADQFVLGHSAMAQVFKQCRQRRTETGAPGVFLVFSSRYAPSFIWREQSREFEWFRLLRRSPLG